MNHKYDEIHEMSGDKRKIRSYKKSFLNEAWITQAIFELLKAYKKYGHFPIIKNIQSKEVACILNTINGLTIEELKKHYLHANLKKKDMKIKGLSYFKPATSERQPLTIFENLLLLYMYYVVMPDDSENEGKLISVKKFHLTFFYKI